jgi:hypothetical protein
VESCVYVLQLRNRPPPNARCKPCENVVLDLKVFGSARSAPPSDLSCVHLQDLINTGLFNALVAFGAFFLPLLLSSSWRQHRNPTYLRYKCLRAQSDQTDKSRGCRTCEDPRHKTNSSFHWLTVQFAGPQSFSSGNRTRSGRPSLNSRGELHTTAEATPNNTNSRITAAAHISIMPSLVVGFVRILTWHVPVDPFPATAPLLVRHADYMRFMLVAIYYC